MTRPLSRLRPSSDDDPTGMQQLLATLPDPGPMPPELIARITASLEREQDRRGPQAPNVRPLPPRSGWRDGDQSGRGASRGLIVALSGAAAAAAVGGVVLINVLVPHRDADPSATAQLYVAAPGAASPTTTPAPNAQEPSPGRAVVLNPVATGSARANSEGGSGATPHAAQGTLDLHVQVSEHRYTRADLARAAGALWRSPSAPLAPLSAEAPGIGPLGTELGMTACLSALGLDASRAVVDLAFYESAPAVVVVTDEGDGTQVRVVDRRCGAGSATTLAGPLAVR